MHYFSITCFRKTQVKLIKESSNWILNLLVVYSIIMLSLPSFKQPKKDNKKVPIEASLYCHPFVQCSFTRFVCNLAMFVCVLFHL